VGAVPTSLTLPDVRFPQHPIRLLPYRYVSDQWGNLSEKYLSAPLSFGRPRVRTSMFKSKIVTAPLAIAVVCGTALVAQGVVTPQARADVPPPSPAAWPCLMPELCERPSATLPAIEGNVLTAEGSPATGATVRLVVWPRNEVEAALVEGDSVKLQELGVGVVEEDGRFALPVAPDLLAPHADSTGLVNLQAIAVDEVRGGLAPHGFTKRLKKNPLTDLWELENVAPEKGVLYTPERVKLVLNEASTDLADGGSTDEAAEEVPLDKSCYAGLVQNLGLAWGIVGQVFHNMSGVTSDFSYMGGASSSLGIGYSVSGALGSWKSSGTNAKSSAYEENFPTQGDYAKKYLWSKFEYGKYRVHCDGSTYAYHYEVRAKQWAGGGGLTSVSSSPTATYCVPKPAGSTYSLASTKSITYTNGADVSKWIGIDLSASTGYSSAAKISGKYGPRGQLCGTNGYPASTTTPPRRLVSKL
jgi:hypothetical protein